MKSVIAIVGRPNVGKSTLFNRLIGKRKAIVDNISGVTRDRQYDFSDWAGKEFIVVDTGGYVTHSDDVFESEIRKQVDFAIDEATVILFMVDTIVGITDLDESFAKKLRKVDKPIIVVANKVDNHEKINDSYVFYGFGFEKVFPVSSINGSGTGELLDEIVIHLNAEERTEDEDLPKISVVGRPNVGKSTYINALLGQERNIVSEIPGTTRDSIHSRYNKFGKDFILIDTAGLRKKAKVYEEIEFYSTVRAIKAIEESDVSILLVDSREGIQSQDMHIVSVVENRNKGIIILLNKWDLVDKQTNTEKELIATIRKKLEPFNDIPIISTSAKDKTRVMKSVEEAIRVFENKTRRIQTSKLNDVMLKAIEAYHPPSVRGKIIRIKYVTQIKASFPLFAFYCNHPNDIRDPYKRYLINQLRSNFDFSGTPIKISFRKK